MEWIQSKGRVVVDPRTLLLADLRRIYNDDPSEFKETANIYLSYIHLVSQLDEKAPYFKSDINEVRQLAKKQLFGSTDHLFNTDLDAFIENAVKDYIQAYEEVDARASRIFRKKIDNLLAKIDSTSLELKESVSRGGTVSYSSNFTIISKMMADVMPLIDAQGELEARVKKMNKKGIKIRGDKRESVLNKRLVQTTKTSGDE